MDDDEFEFEFEGEGGGAPSLPSRKTIARRLQRKRQKKKKKSLASYSALPSELYPLNSDLLFGDDDNKFADEVEREEEMRFLPPHHVQRLKKETQMRHAMARRAQPLVRQVGESRQGAGTEMGKGKGGGIPPRMPLASQVVRVGTMVNHSQSTEGACMVPGMSTNQRDRVQICPIEGCGHCSSHMEWHVYFHFPDYFMPREMHNELTQELLWTRADALDLIAEYLIGERATIHDLMHYVNLHLEVKEAFIPEEIKEEIKALALQKGWTPVVPSLTPLNTPAALIHWRPLSFMFNQLSDFQRVQLASLNGKRRLDCEASLEKGLEQGQGTLRQSAYPQAQGEDAFALLNRLEKEAKQASEDALKQLANPGQGCVDAFAVLDRLEKEAKEAREGALKQLANPQQHSVDAIVPLKGLQEESKQAKVQGALFQAANPLPLGMDALVPLNHLESEVRHAQVQKALYTPDRNPPAIVPLNHLERETRQAQGQGSPYQPANPLPHGMDALVPLKHLERETRHAQVQRAQYEPDPKTPEIAPLNHLERETRQAQGQGSPYQPANPLPHGMDALVPLKHLEREARHAQVQRAQYEPDPKTPEMVPLNNFEREVRQAQVQGALFQTANPLPHGMDALAPLNHFERETRQAQVQKALYKPPDLLPPRMDAMVPLNSLEREGRQAQSHGAQYQIPDPPRFRTDTMVPLNCSAREAKHTTGESAPSQLACRGLTTLYPSTSYGKGEGRGMVSSIPVQTQSMLQTAQPSVKRVGEIAQSSGVTTRVPPASLGKGKGTGMLPAVEAQKRSMPQPSHPPAKRVGDITQANATGTGIGKGCGSTTQLPTAHRGARLGNTVYPPVVVPEVGKKVNPSQSTDVYMASSTYSNGKSRSCPFKGCVNVGSKRLKWHVYSHLPNFFVPRKPPEILTRKLLCMRVEALRLIASFLVRKNAKIDHLKNYVNQNWEVKDASIADDIRMEINALANHEGWSKVVPSLTPINTPAALIHWRPLAFLLDKLTVSQRSQVDRLDKEGTASLQKESALHKAPPPIKQVSELNRERGTELRISKEGNDQSTLSQPADLQPPSVECLDQDAPYQPDDPVDTYIPDELVRPLSPGVLPGFDSHFHPSRIPTIPGGEKKLQDPNRKPDHPVQFVGGVLNYSDPEELIGQQLKEILGRTRSQYSIAIGIHPKWASIFGTQVWNSFISHLRHNRVCAISDVGLDFTVPSTQWESQKELLAKILDMKVQEYVLVMHLCGAKQDPTGQVVQSIARRMMVTRCQPSQRIHLHSFCGDGRDVMAWLSRYPRCYFGFNGLVRSFSTEQRRALRVVPLNRLLLETDSPYNSPHDDMVFNTPEFIGDVGQLVADIRGIPLVEVMETTWENALVLYGGS